MDQIFLSFLQESESGEKKVPQFDNVHQKDDNDVSFIYDEHTWCGQWSSGKTFYEKSNGITYTVLRVTLPTDGFWLRASETYSDVICLQKSVSRHRGAFDTVDANKFGALHVSHVFDFAEKWFGDVRKDDVGIWAWLDSSSQRIDIHFYLDAEKIALFVQFEIGMPVPTLKPAFKRGFNKQK